MPSPRFRIGVDVGGTNTDGVILDPTNSSGQDRGIIAWKKSSTTRNPSDGINNVIREMFEQSSVDPQSVASVTIGTTHFINAVVEMDQSRLAKVAVLRLCGPFSKDIPIGIDWPPRLRDIVCGHRGLIDGGLEIDGSLISELDENEVRRQAEVIKSMGIKSVAVVGIFSPIDIVYRQEEKAAEIIKGIYPECDIVCSKYVANIGFLERENAAILNASILPFARRTIHAFEQAVSQLKLTCPIFVTQNDGTILPASAAARLPIRTFSSGPTNSMRGAAFLMQDQKIDEAMMVVDIGGTTTDVGLLQKNGFPRQAAAFSEIAGVRTNYSYPDVRSIGLGGGSIVGRDKDGKITVGPESVGYQIQSKALVFKGDVPTATDYTVLGDQDLTIGDRALVDSTELRDSLAEFKDKVKSMLETIVDTMKTSPGDIPVVLVGGGAIIAPDELTGASRVVKPNWSGVANAIGAATARVGGVVDSVENTEGKSVAEVTAAVSQRAVEAAVASGALRETVAIAEVETFPLQYIANKLRIIVKAVGDYDFSRTGFASETVSIENGGEDGFADDTDDITRKTADNHMADDSPDSSTMVFTKEYINSYKPTVLNREWVLSETDLQFITIGCYILGTGGGGSPYQHYLRLREMVRGGAKLRVISPRDLKDDDIVACGGGKGSPQVSIEKPYGDEMMESQRELYAFLNKKPDAVIPLEIGGGNGLQGLIIGASTNLDIPAIDGDWMGRAYPVSWQTTPVVFEKKAMMVPTCISDGNGRIIFMTKAPTELDIERALRAALSQMGSHVGCAKGPVSGKNTKEWVIENTMSLSWRIGRAVALSRCNNTVDTVADSIIAEVGGDKSAKLLFKGKIVGVERVTRMGHAYGEVIIESTAGKDSKEKLIIPFKNENIYAKKIGSDGKEEILAVVPDLVCVIDAQNGEALGTQEYRYGLPVIVLGITASEKWTSTERGIEIGGPKGFGFNDLEYKALGTFSKPRSVIDEFSR
ncbi:N-methylhydantoinase A/oxoprolinase/acetone carboxylase, beta subunit [Geosmithia morbida]|uniref:N-methylhydantoinase A/oxoprolinase/acetone carboxylase, beta subunit n=1 Tax=Geosmithia morbida TaxID=1094350 RepID=A0A9P5D111_9HYPO|nr:N-methylhydantoinase A/oxoprolinase/acetone carboxylase, beta subunit [Geosmithia morbida]KAF4119405.1 N-methylhydantoinase A/oxoprolinase/acetone carboxylase, beta subunit [Geosmithia morbida]